MEVEFESPRALKRKADDAVSFLEGPRKQVLPFNNVLLPLLTT